MRLIRLNEADNSEENQLLINDVISYYGTQLSDEEVEELVSNLHRQAHDIIARKSKVNDMVNSDDMDELIHDWEKEISDDQSDYNPGEEILDPSRVRRREPGGDLYLNDEDSPTQRVDRRLSRKKLNRKQRKSRKPSRDELIDLDEPLPSSDQEDTPEDDEKNDSPEDKPKESDKSREDKKSEEDKSEEKNEFYRISARRKSRR